MRRRASTTSSGSNRTPPGATTTAVQSRARSTVAISPIHKCIRCASKRAGRKFASRLARERVDRDFRVMLRADVMHGLLAWLDWRRSGPRFGAALLLLGSALVSAGCATAAAGAVTFGVAAVGILTSTCYDRVSLRLIDAASGQRLCDARVRAVDADGSELEFSSCFHAAVPRGTWTISAERPGYAPANTRLIVPVESNCGSAVQSVDLTIAPVGYHPPQPIATSAPSAPPAPPQAAPAPSVPPATSAARCRRAPRS